MAYNKGYDSRTLRRAVRYFLVEEVAEKLSVPPNERGYIVSAFDENIDGTFLNAYKALQKVTFHGVAVIFFPKSGLIYFEGEPEYRKSFRCVKKIANSTESQ